MQDPNLPYQGHPSFSANFAQQGQSIQPQTRLQNLSQRLSSEAPDHSVKKNLNDQSGAVWQRRSPPASTIKPTRTQQPAQPTTAQYYPAQHEVVQPGLIAQPRTQQGLVIGHSFAPPADLGRLSRAQVQSQEPPNPQLETEAYSNLYRNDSSIYRSPIDTLSIRSNNDGDHSTDAHTAASDLDHSHANLPQRDQNTDLDAFAPRTVASDELFQQTQPPEQPARVEQPERETIVLRSQKIRPQPTVKPINPPSFQLLTPDFDSYVGSPNVQSVQQRYDDSWQYTRVTNQQPSDLPPPPTPTQLPSPPAAVAFEPVVPAPAATFETDQFQAKGITRSANDIFASAVVKSQPVKKEWVNPFANAVARTPVAQPKINKTISDQPVLKTASASYPSTYRPSLTNYRVESHQSQFNANSATVASTIAQPIAKMPQIEASGSWLSPWWMLACLAPFALFLLLRKSREEDFDYESESFGKQIHLPPEMLETPGYSKSDAIFSESDDFFMTERVVGARRQRFKTKESQFSYDNEIKRTGRLNEISDLDAEFARANVQQRATELSPNSSPNFRIDKTLQTDSKSSDTQTNSSATIAPAPEAQITEFRQINPGVKVPNRSTTKQSKKRRSKRQNKRR